MKHLLSTMTLVLGIVLAGCDKDDGSKTDSLSEDIHFVEATYSFANAGRPYRRAEINPKEGVTPAVVVYLHGGSARGEDNTKQMDPRPDQDALVSVERALDCCQGFFWS